MELILIPNYSLLYLQSNDVNNLKKSTFEWKKSQSISNCYENPQIMLVCKQLASENCWRSVSTRVLPRGEDVEW